MRQFALLLALFHLWAINARKKCAKLSIPYKLLSQGLAQRATGIGCVDTGTGCRCLV